MCAIDELKEIIKERLYEQRVQRGYFKFRYFSYELCRNINDDLRRDVGKIILIKKF